MPASQELSPGLIVIHGNHLEELRALAVQWMRRYPLRPLENEVLLVQSNGIAQWLKLALAERDGCGIAAALDVDLPARFLWQAYRSVLGRDAIPPQSPLDKAPLTWRLMRLLPGLLSQDVFAPLRRFLAEDPDLRKRHQLAERLADLFDQYQVYRVRQQHVQPVLVGHPQVAVILVQPMHCLLQGMAGAHAAGARVGMHQLLRSPGRLEQRLKLGPQELEVAHRLPWRLPPALAHLSPEMGLI